VGTVMPVRAELPPDPPPATVVDDELVDLDEQAVDAMISATTGSKILRMSVSP